MAGSQQAASASQIQAIQELQDELCFQQVLLRSIDDKVQDKENAAQQVKQEIAVLEKQLKALKRGNKPTASNPSTTVGSFQASYSRDTPSKNTDAERAAEFMDGYMSKSTAFLHARSRKSMLHFHVFLSILLRTSPITSNILWQIESRGTARQRLIQQLLPQTRTLPIQSQSSPHRLE